MSEHYAEDEVRGSDPTDTDMGKRIAELERELESERSLRATIQVSSGTVLKRTCADLDEAIKRAEKAERELTVIREIVGSHEYDSKPLATYVRELRAEVAALRKDASAGQAAG